MTLRLVVTIGGVFFSSSFACAEYLATTVKPGRVALVHWIAGRIQVLVQCGWVLVFALPGVHRQEPASLPGRNSGRANNRSSGPDRTVRPGTDTGSASCRC